MTQVRLYEEVHRIEVAYATMADNMEPEVPPPRPDLVLEWLDLLGGQTPPSPAPRKNLEYLSLADRRPGMIRAQ